MFGEVAAHSEVFEGSRDRNEKAMSDEQATGASLELRLKTVR